MGNLAHVLLVLRSLKCDGNRNLKKQLRPTLQADLFLLLLLTNAALTMVLLL